MTQSHEAMIRKCYQLAERAITRGSQPYGALLARAGEAFMKAENEVHIDGDNTRHVELVLASRAMRELSPEVISETVLYTSTEPCAMCAGAVYWSGIPMVVFGVSIEAVARLKEVTLMMPCREVFASGTHSVEVIGPLLEEEGLAVHRKYW